MRPGKEAGSRERSGQHMPRVMTDDDAQPMSCSRRRPPGPTRCVSPEASVDTSMWSVSRARLSGRGSRGSCSPHVARPTLRALSRGKNAAYTSKVHARSVSHCRPSPEAGCPRRLRLGDGQLSLTPQSAMVSGWHRPCGKRKTKGDESMGMCTCGHSERDHRPAGECRAAGCRCKSFEPVPEVRRTRLCPATTGRRLPRWPWQGGGRDPR